MVTVPNYLLKESAWLIKVRLGDNMERSLIYRSKIILTAYKGWISPFDRVLDVGCGNGVVTAELRRHFGCAIVGTDILDYRKREITFKIMTDPNKLPFTDREFDICMLNDALHHCSDQKAMMKEAFRVADRILIFEVEPTFVAKTVDYIVNQMHNFRMNIPLSMKTPMEWRGDFEIMGLDFEYRKIKKPSWVYPFSNFAFNLREAKQKS